AAWDAKYTYGSWRPIDAIRLADSDGNPDTSADAGWNSFLLTPPHPDYVSGHSTYSAAAAEVLTHVFGDHTGFSITSVALPGVTRSFADFGDAAQEAGRSRIYGGIHFEFSNQDGQATGKQVADWVLDQFDLKADQQAPKVLLDQSSGAVTKGGLVVTGQVLD